MGVDTKFGAILARSREAGRAVGAFTCYDLLGFEAVVRAAESRRAPVVVLVSPSSFGAEGGERLVRALVAASRGALVEVLVQLDHARDERLIERAAELRRGRRDGRWLEAPLRGEPGLHQYRGALHAFPRRRGRGRARPGRRPRGRGGRALSGEMTEPDEAERFVDETGVDCLAVAAGNVHGHYSGAPDLDWRRLEEIRERVPAPLSLHGASGLSEEVLRRAASLGVAKFNVNTELRAAYFGLLEDELVNRVAALDLKSLGDGVVEAVQEVVESKLSAFGWTREEA